MSNDKKHDLTRIEDLGEFLHDLTSDEESSDVPDFSGEDSSSTDEASPFDSDLSSFQDVDATETNEEATKVTTDFSSDTLASEEAPMEQSSFESDPFQTTNFESPGFESDLTSETLSLNDESFGNDDDRPFALSEPEPVRETSFDDEPTSSTQFEREDSPVHSPPPVSTYKSPENFEDLKKFAENTSFTGMGAEGNPSFSVLVKNVRFIEDVNDIVTLLKELGLAAEAEDQLKSRLMRGSLLVPRISEFSAIFLAHKLRRFDIDIQVGLSDEIHPPKHQERPETGLVSKHSLFQNQSHNFHFDDPKLEISQIIVAATPGLEGHQVLRYIGVASEHKMLDSHIVEDETSQEVPHHYTELAQKLKAHALKAHANAVVGLNYQLTPMPTELGISGHKYRLTCTGNLVWVNKL